MAGNQGLGSSNMDQSKKDEIHSKGGKASSSSRGTNTNSDRVITNKQGGGALTEEDQSLGGQNS